MGLGSGAGSEGGGQGDSCFFALEHKPAAFVLQLFFSIAAVRCADLKTRSPYPPALPLTAYQFPAPAFL